MTTADETIMSPSRQSAIAREVFPVARPVRSLCGVAALAGVAASAATFGLAGVAHALDVPLRISGEQIPSYSFVELTLAATIAGLVVAIAAASRAARPRRTFVRATLALTGLSFVPDLLVDAQTATRITLMLTHVAAAAIVIPALASRLARSGARHASVQR